LIIYFKQQSEREHCYRQVLKHQGFGAEPIQQYYLHEARAEDVDEEKDVLTAQHKITGKHVCIKVIAKPSKDAYASPELLLRWHLASLRMNVFSKLIEHFEDDEYQYLVTAQLKGSCCSLQKLMQKMPSVMSKSPV